MPALSFDAFLTRLFCSIAYFVFSRLYLCTR